MVGLMCAAFPLWLKEREGGKPKHIDTNTTGRENGAAFKYTLEHEYVRNVVRGKKAGRKNNRTCTRRVVRIDR